MALSVSENWFWPLVLEADGFYTKVNGRNNGGPEPGIIYLCVIKNLVSRVACSSVQTYLHPVLHLIHFM